MAIPVFSPPKQPSTNGTQLDETPRIITSNYGDGYNQDTPDGLNVVVGQVSLSWTNLGVDDASTIISFFRNNAGKPFSYQLPREPSARAWICTKWTRMYPAGALDSIQASLVERFVL